MRTLKVGLYRFLNESRIGSAAIGALVILSVAVFALETEFGDIQFYKQIGLVIAGAFGLEYALRVWVADLSDAGRKGYMLSFGGLIDLIAFLPALMLAGGSASVVLRILRVFRLLQLLKIGALSRGIARTRRAVASVSAELAVSAVMAAMLIFLGAVAMFFVEGTVQPETFGSIPRALWWSMATLTTVGYGDVYPVTALGKMVAGAMAIVGIGAVALPAGILASAFMNVDEEGPD